jgi:hypothetical protein
MKYKDLIKDINSMTWGSKNKNPDVFIMDYASLYPTMMRDLSMINRANKIRKILNELERI